MPHTEYTMTDDDVREAVDEWTWARRMSRPELNGSDDGTFDRWLAAHDRAVAEKALTDAAEPLRIARQLVEMYRHLVMDTPEDQELHDEITASADRAFAALGVPVGTEKEGKN